MSIEVNFFQNDHKSRHVKEIDGLRGLAILIVMLSHSRNANIYFHKFMNLERTGKIGVYLFFVLSAYLLDQQIAKAFINKKSNYKFWKNYVGGESLESTHYLS